MAHIQWRNEFSTGVAQFDAEHQKLVAMVNALFGAMTQGTAQETLGRVLGGLVDYTKRHFAHEEELMKRHGFPGLAEHMAVHKALTDQVLALQKDYQAGKTALSIKVANFLKDWLTNHILSMDKQYGPYLNSKGVR